MQTLAARQRAFLERLDVEYSYQLAKRMEQFRSNPVLGYRTAGSKAEFETGEMLFQEMKRIGLRDVVKDPFTLDTWEFSHAKLSFDGIVCELGGYQTNFDTQGPREFQLLYAGRGTAADLDGLDLEGKLVLITINQREDWWISYPVYEAYLRRASAVIAVQDNGYGQVDSAALNAQNICSIPDAPAFSISQRDAKKLMSYLEAHGGEAAVTFDAKSTVGRNGTSYNIVGKIPGKEPEAMILLSAHYDSYFSGFQDDNAAVAMMLGIAKALVESGIQPRKTLVFCAMAAEEWGVANSKYDWSTGAYNQIYRVHPDWVGKVWADINFELPAYAHDTQDVIRCVYEYQTFLKDFVETVPDVTHLYPDGVSVVSPVLTWSDDFSLSIAGVPSMVNDFAGGSFMSTHYHSQFDNDDAYDPSIYQQHHQLYGTLLLAYDWCPAAPLDFSVRLEALRDSLDLSRASLCEGEWGNLLEAISNATTQAELCWKKTQSLCRRYRQALQEENQELLDALWDFSQEWNQGLLEAYKFCEDEFVRLTWHDDVIFPHEYAQRNLAALEGALKALENQDPQGALDDWLHKVDTNWYAYYFSDGTCRHFVDYVLEQPEERLMWGAGRILGACELFDTVRALQKKCDTGESCQEQAEEIRQAIENMEDTFRQTIAQERAAVEALSQRLEGLLQWANKE